MFLSYLNCNYRARATPVSTPHEKADAFFVIAKPRAGLTMAENGFSPNSKPSVTRASNTKGPLPKLKSS